MALGITERLRIIFDVETQSFKQGVKTLKADLAAADGMAGKAKVGFAALGQQLSQYGAQAALAAGAALVAFGTKAVKVFQDTALAAGEFSDRSGASVEDASRWIAVADDFGIAGTAVQTAFQRMNLAIEGNKFEKYGLDVQRAADGTIDANATFLQTATEIGKIPDAAERARAAQDVFGRSWGDISRLMQMDAEDLAAALEGVSDAQVIDEDEEAKAKRLQASMDNAGDAVLDLQLALGEQLVPAITKTVDAVEDLKDVTDVLPDSVTGALSAVQQWINPLDEIADGLSDMTEKGNTLGQRFLGLAQTIPWFGDAVGWVSDKLGAWGETIEATGPGWDRLIANMGDAADGSTTLAGETDELATEMVTARSDADQYASAMDGLNQRLVDAKEAVDNLVGEELSKIDAFQRAEDSTRNYTESVEAYVLASMDAETSEKDKADALREAARAAIDAARDMATFKDGTYESVDGLATQIQALKDMAAALGPNDPLRAELLAHIGLLEGIQTEVETDVKFDVDEGSVKTAQSTRDNLGKPVQVQVTYLSNGTIVDENGNVVLGRSAGAGGAAGAPNSMGPSGLLQGALNFFANLVGGSGGAGGGSSSEPKASELFAKDMDRLRNMYEVGDLSPAQYVRRLQRLMTQPGYRFRRLSPPWMAWWREVKRAKADAKAAAEAATKPDVEVDDSAAWEQASENQAAIEAGRNLSSTASESQAALADDDPNNDAAALDAWAQAIWRDIEARANRKFKNNRGRGWARFARARLERAIADNPLLASRLRVYLSGIPKFGGGNDPDREDTVTAAGPSTTPPTGAGAGGGGSRASTVSSAGRDGLTVHVTISAPNAAIVDGKAVRAAIPAIAAELRRFERGQG
jgi:hypothetical protein